jgi:hypothetical protein
VSRQWTDISWPGAEILRYWRSIELVSTLEHGSVVRERAPAQVGAVALADHERYEWLPTAVEAVHPPEPRGTRRRVEFGWCGSCAAWVAVTANDVDPYAVAAITLNAEVNGVLVTECLADLLDGDGGDAETVLAGDIFYTGIMAQRVLAFLERVAARGAQVLVGDPGREHSPRDRMQTVATYQLPLVDAFADTQLTQMNVLRLRR